MVETPTSVHAYDPIADNTITTQVPRELKASWITIMPGEQGPAVELDPVRVQQYLESIAGELGQGLTIDAQAFSEQLEDALLSGTDARVRVSHTPTNYTIQPGDTMLKIGWNMGIHYWMIVNANPGSNPDSLIAGQVIEIPSRDDLLPYPVVPDKRIIISISEQRLWVYENGELLSKHVISTGIDRSPTQPGVFQVQTHEKNAYASVWDLHMPNFLGIYEAWPGFMNGIHGLPTLSSGRRLWANVLGRPASYGCIIMQLDAAEWLYNWAENGVIVEIRP